MLATGDYILAAVGVIVVYFMSCVALKEALPFFYFRVKLQSNMS
jgi:hypothetical protein